MKIEHARYPSFKEGISLLSFLIFILFCRSSFAQVKPPLVPADTSKKSQLIKKAFDQKVSGLKEEFKNQVPLSDTAKRNELFKKFSKQSLVKKGSALKDSLRKNKPVRLNHFEIQNSTLFNGYDSRLQKTAILNNISVTGQIQVFKMPLAIDLSNNADDLRSLDPIKDALFKVNFDKSQIRQVYQKDMDKYTQFKKKELSGLDIPSYLKKGILEQFGSSSLINLSQFPKLEAVLKDKNQLSGLLSLNERQLKDRINQLMTSEKQRGSALADSLSDEKKLLAQKEVDLKKAEVTKVVTNVKEKIADNGLDQQRLLLLQKFVANKGSTKDFEALLDNEMNQPGNLTGVARFYSRIRQLQAGNFGQKMPGGIMNRDLMINGFNFAVNTERGPVNIGLGISKDVGMPKDGNFNSSIFGAPKLLTFVTVPSTNFAFGRGKLSWVGSFDRQSNTGLSQISALPKNGVAFFLGQDFNTSRLGRFSFELGKSGAQYKNIGIGETDKLMLNKDLKTGNFFNGDFTESMSVGVKHNIEIKKLGLTSSTFFSYSGLGYQNPGQQGYNAMGMRLGGAVKKNLMKNRLVLNVRTDIKNTPISTMSGAHWRNYNVQLDSRFKVSKNYTVNLKYGENGVNKVDGAATSIYSAQNMQADMNANYKIGGNYGFSFLSVGKQAMFNPTLFNNTNFMTFVYSQNVVMKSISLSANAFYNKELSGAKLLGDLLNADMGCQYTLLKKLNVTSAITYLDNQNVARQVGLRQNIQLNVLKDFDVSAFVDVRKNLVNPVYPDLFSTGRGELSIRYYIK